MIRYDHDLELKAVSLIGDRKTQEDAYGQASWRGGMLLVLCDGLGGYGGGEIAATAFRDVATQAILNYHHRLNAPKVLDDYLAYVSERFKQKLIESHEEEANTTVAMAIILEDAWISIHIGDTRIYQFRDHTLHFRTHDHSYLQKQLELGKISEEEMINHPQQNLLNRSMNINEQNFEIAYHPKLKKSDTLLIASDGLWTKLSFDEILSVSYDVNNIDALAQTAQKRGRPHADNITALVLKCP